MAGPATARRQPQDAVHRDRPVRLRAAVFDLDDTLLDFLRMKRLASDAAGRAMVRAGADFPWSVHEVGDVLFGEYVGDLEGDRVFESFLRSHHQQKLRLDQHAVDRITAAAVNAYLEAKRLHTRPHASVTRTLLELARRQFRMGVVTDAPRFKAYQRLDLAGLTDFFDFVKTGDDPTERLLRDAVDLLQVRPQECLAVGAWSTAEVQAAKNLGMPVAWAGYARPGAEAPAGVDHVLKRFGDLLKVEAFSG